MKSFVHGVEELQKLLELGRQHWFLGAGVSAESGIPLMYPLTKRVEDCLDEDNAQLFKRIMGDLPTDAHVEHSLSHLGDLIALAERSRSKTCRIENFDASLEILEAGYKAIIKAIATTVRYGYCAAAGTTPERVGTPSTPLVDVDAHRQFVRQLFKGRTNLESRSTVGFITTNYDTLLEDALAMEQRVPLDGFSGGAIAFWNGENIDPDAQDLPRSHKVLKLHGSVDWFRDAAIGLLRVRYGMKYLADLTSTLIYPQSTKYVETQKDPFARIFDCFRRSMRNSDGHLLAIVGYSFGDSHINAEIENALSDRANKTTLVAFSKEIPISPNATETTLCPTLSRWVTNSQFGSRIYVASDKALYKGRLRVTPISEEPLSWWRFSGLTTFLEQGLPA